MVMMSLGLPSALCVGLETTKGRIWLIMAESVDSDKHKMLQRRTGVSVETVKLVTSVLCLSKQKEKLNNLKRRQNDQLHLWLVPTVLKF